MTSMRTRHRPRQWQREALDAWTSEFRGVVSVVTGAGKTFFAMQCMLAVWDTRPQTRVLIVVPTIALMDQWRVALRDELKLQDRRHRSFRRGIRRLANSRVTLGVLNSVRGIAHQLTEQGTWFLIVDECHRAASPTNRKILDGKYIATLGLSATPEREYDDFFQTVVSPRLGSIVFRYDYEDASRDGIISPFELWNIRVAPNSSEQKQLDLDSRAIHMESRRLRETGEESSPRLRNLLLRRSRNSQRVRSRIPTAIALRRTLARSQRPSGFTIDTIRG